MATRSDFLREHDPVPKLVEQHMLGMGFVESREYLDWCWANGFEGTLDKSRFDLREEREAFEAAAARRVKHNRLHKHPKAFLEAVCAGDLTWDEIERPAFKRVAAEIEASNESSEVRRSLLDTLLCLIKFDDMAFQSVPGREDVPFIRGLIKLHDRKALWLRPLEEWKPKRRNQERRFGELAHHLFDKYGDVPRFMDAVWLRNDRASWRFRDWYVHLGRGYNLRTAKSPIPMTKKMAHHFIGAPDNYSVEQAARWGQAKALGAGEAAIHAVAATRLGRSFENENFWFTVIRFIADNPMLDPRQIGPVIDYLHHQRFEPTEVETAPGQWRLDPPAQPGLSMNGRTVDTLMRQVAAWHDGLGRMSALPGGKYDEAPFDGMSIDRKADGKTVNWVIRQLRTAKDLQLESEALRHCVASYHWSCARGHCTIWSLSKSEGGAAFERRQTIEVDKDHMIVQCRGLANRDPSNEEWAIVNAWAREANLQISSYL